MKIISFPAHSMSVVAQWHPAHVCIVPALGSVQNCWQIPGWCSWWEGRQCCPFVLDRCRNRGGRRSWPSRQPSPAAWSRRSGRSSGGGGCWRSRFPGPETQPKPLSCLDGRKASYPFSQRGGDGGAARSLHVWFVTVASCIMSTSKYKGYE